MKRPIEPAAPEVRPAKQPRSAASGDPLATGNSTPQAVDGAGKISTGAEELFMQVFSLQDTPGKNQVRALATKTDCDEDRVRSFFSKLRSSMRNYLQRSQRRANSGPAGTGPPTRAAASPAQAPEGGEGAGGGPPSPLAAVQRAGTGREAGLRKLGLLLDEGGGLRDSSVTGQFNQLMSNAEAATLRCALLHALCATKRSGVRAKLLHHGSFLLILEAWLREGEEDGQATLLLLLLQVLEDLPLSAAGLKGMPGLGKGLARLRTYGRHPQVVAAAQQLWNKWQASLGLPPAETGCGGPPGRRAPAEVSAGPAAGIAQDVHQQAGAGPGAGEAGLGGGAAAAPAPGVAAALRKPAAGEVPQLVALGRKKLFGKAATNPSLAFVGPGVGGDEGDAGTPQGGALRGAMPQSLRRLASGGTEAAAAPSPCAPLERPLSSSAARTARPMSVDDIRKAKERARASAALQSLQGGGPVRRPGAGVADSATAVAAAAVRLPHAQSQAQQQQQPLPQAHHQQQQRQQQAVQWQAAGPGLRPVLGAAGAAAPPGDPELGPAPLPGSILGAGGWGSSGGLRAEMAGAVQAHEQDRQRKAAARRVQLVQEYAAMDEASRRLPAMQPALRHYYPPPTLTLPPLDAPLGRGEESTEAPGQQARQALLPPALYPHPSSIPPSPAEPPEHPPSSEAATPLVPFVSLDPQEAQAQNERLLQDGVRLPQFVSLG